MQTKIVYEEEGGEAHAIKGEIIEENDTFIKVIETKTGKEFKIPISRIIKIVSNNFTEAKP